MSEIEVEVDYRQGSSEDDRNSSDVQEERDVDEANTPNPEGLPVADSSLYYRIPPNTAGLNPTTESKYACSLLEHRSCLATFHKTWQLQDHFAHVHHMYVPPPRRGNPKRALKPRPRSKPREDNLLKQKLRNGGDFELKWWRKKTSRMKAFIVKVLTKWHVDGVHSENNSNLKLVTNPPSLARLLIRYPQTALPIPEDSRPLDKQIVDDERWATWESALESFWVTNDGRIALNNVVERARMDLDQIEDEEEREQMRRACSLLEVAFPFNLGPRPTATSSHDGTGPWRLGIQAGPVLSGRAVIPADLSQGGRSTPGGRSLEPLQDAHRVNIVNAARDWMSRWRQYLLAVGSRVDKDKWVGEKSIEMYRTWRRGKLPLEDYETCKMLSWRFWTPARQKNYPEQFAEALRGFPDSQDLCSSEEEPPLELEDFLSKKVGTNNLPKFDHKLYLKRRKARKAAREARREAGEEVPEPQRPRLTDGATLQMQSSFNFSGLSSWIGETGQRKELGYTSSETPKSAQLGGVGSVRRREFSGFGRKRKHIPMRGIMSADDNRGTGHQQTADLDPNDPTRQSVVPFGQPRPAPPRLIPGGMTAEQLSMLETLQQMRNDELEQARLKEEEELQQRATGFDEMRRDLRRADADKEQDLMKEKQGKRVQKGRRERRKGGTSLGGSRESDVERDSREPDFL
ncbi:unnamed protein product [Calypogeia fissa]